VAAGLRKAFHESFQGRGKVIADQAFGDRMGIERKLTEASRRLGDSADRQPTWELLDAIVELGHRDPLLEYLGPRLRVRWTPIHDSPEALRARAVERLELLHQELEAIRADLGLAVRAERRRSAQQSERG